MPNFQSNRLVVCLILIFVFAAIRVVSANTPKVQKGAMEFHLVKHDVSPPLRLLPPAPRPAGVKFIRNNPRIPDNSLFKPDGALQKSATGLAPTTNKGDFEAIGEGINGYSVCCVPPDTNGDVGPNDYVQIVNIDYAVFNKTTGAIKFGPVAINTLWAGFGGGCERNNDGDPVVTYDQFTDRWIITQFSVSRKPYLECVAVSTGSSPTGSYNRFAYSFGKKDFPDYPKVAVWPGTDTYYITFNIFHPFFAGARACAFQGSKLRAGQSNSMQCFTTSSSFGSLLAADLDGRPVSNPTADEYLVDRNGNGLSSWRFHVDWTNPANSTFTGPTSVSNVAAYSTACGGGSCIPQAGTTNKLDSLGDRLMHRLAYRVLTGHDSLVASHSVTSGSTTGIRWYELRPSGNGLNAFQQGTFAPADATYRWMPSIAMDKLGNVAVGYSVSSSSINPGIRYTGRLATDAAGTMQTEATIINGTGSQTTYDRWGDYSSIEADPVDDCTFYFTTEYLTQTNVFNWHTRVGHFKFSNCS